MDIKLIILFSFLFRYLPSSRDLLTNTMSQMPVVEAHCIRVQVQASLIPWLAECRISAGDRTGHYLQGTTEIQDWD